MFLPLVPPLHTYLQFLMHQFLHKGDTYATITAMTIDVFEVLVWGVIPERMLYNIAFGRDHNSNLFVNYCPWKTIYISVIIGFMTPKVDKRGIRLI